MPRCSHEIRWSRTASQKPIPLDVEPNMNGNVAIRHGVAYVLGKLDADAARAAGEELFMPHHATCDEWNR